MVSSNGNRRARPFFQSKKNPISQSLHDFHRVIKHEYKISTMNRNRSCTQKPMNRKELDPSIADLNFCEMCDLASLLGAYGQFIHGLAEKNRGPGVELV